MSYWELEEELWESEDNWDGAKWMEDRGRKQMLEAMYQIETDESSI